MTRSDVPRGHELAEVRDYVLAVQACTNADPVLMVEARHPDGLAPADELERALVDGRVDAAIKEHDIAYSWRNYVQFDTEDGPPTPLAGTFAVAYPKPVLTTLPPRELRRLWRWLVTVRGSYAHEPPHPHDPDRLVSDLESVLYGTSPAEWRHWTVTPDFLSPFEDEVPDADGRLGYFDALGTNLAVLGIGRVSFLLFLLSAYPPLPGSKPCP